jgi:DNA replication factor GINS
MMDLDELQSAQSRERQTDSLQQLRPSFYEDAGEFIQSLRERRERAAEQADDPFDAPEVNRLTDDINTAEDTVEAIYERRVGKIVKMASLAAADMPTGDDGLTAEEQDLFETLVGAIENNREHVLDVLAGETSPTDDADSEATAAETTGSASPTRPDHAPESHETDRVDPPTPSTEDAGAETPAVDAADLMGGADDEAPAESGRAVDDPPVPPSESDRSEDGTDSSRPSDDRRSADDSSPIEATDGGDRRGASGDSGRPEPSGQATRSDDGAAAIERTTVRITDDVGAIYGVDQREYDLSTDDVVCLPAANAEPLVDSDVAERLQ